MHKTFWSENLKGRNHVADLGIIGGIILIWCGCGDLIRLTPDTGQQQALRKQSNKLLFPYKVGQLSAS
jgi:hypothetical protein